MKVLIACEESGEVRRAFCRYGHDAWSCDLLPAADGSPYHIQADVRAVLHDGWDLMIAHPPCDHLAVSGARWFKSKGRRLQEEALLFVYHLMFSPIPKIAVENPVSIISSRIRRPDQIIQPWQFGERQTKATCLWLKGLPCLTPTNIVGPPRTPEEKKEFAKCHRAPPGPDRKKIRARTTPGVADAIASQWGALP